MAKKVKKTDKPKKTQKLTAKTADKHILYEASVQGVEANILFIEEIFSKTRGRKPHILREDFCGTAKMACEWAAWNRKNQAWGIDLDKPTLDWGREQHWSKLNSAQSRVHLIQVGENCRLSERIVQ